MMARFQKIGPDEQLKYGDIILFKPISLRGRLIRFFESLHFGKYAVYSHGALFWGYEEGFPLFIEAEFGSGVDIKKLDPSYGNVDVFRALDLDCVPRFTATSLLDLGYDNWEIFDIVLFYLFHRPFRKQYDKKMICTELINYCYLDMLGEVGHATPASIYKLISENL